MNQVHAPYHFVPLSQWVYTPDWAHLVSHDHPFRDGLSGTLHYELSNRTPLLVGGDQERKANQPARIQWSCDPDGKPVIPGSSLKGMIRNVLEIATFAKFKQVDDSHFGYRDFSTGSTYLTELNKNRVDVHAAWLSFDSTSKSWFLRKAKHVKLFTSDLKKATKSEFSHELTAIKKYKIWQSTGNGEIFFDIIEKVTKKSRYLYANNLELNQKNASNQGYPIFTSNRPGKDESLRFDYVFYDVDDRKHPCDALVVQKMFSAHTNEKEECDIGQFLKQHPIPGLGIPVFFHQDKNNGSIIAMGFTKMPKLLYKKSIKDLIIKPHNAVAVFDFPELLFGTLSHSGFSLKSRVSFADAICQVDKGRKLSSAVILGQPKASYLGAYLEQKANASGDAIHSNLSQYDATSQLSGWKRYPAQTGFRDKIPEELRSKVNVQSQLELMAPQSRFAGKIVFHNLKAEELGALIWALTPDGEQDAHFHHGLGHGKSLGAGAVQFHNLQLTLRHTETVTQDTLRELFVSHMNSVYPATTGIADGWSHSTQIRHLLAFGDRADNEGKDLSYMPLTDYTDSMKKLKKVLPVWNYRGEQLPRNENVKKEAVEKPAAHIGLGRLHDLLLTLESEGALTDWDKQAMAKAVTAAAQAKENALRSTLSPLGSQLYDLYSELKKHQGKTGIDSQNFRTDQAGAIDSMIKEYLAATPMPEQREASMLYDMATDMTLSGYFDLSIKPKDLSKKKKERYKERKQLLTSLCETFALPGGKH